MCSDIVHLVYTITDIMGTVYVGISSENRMKNRFSQHKKSPRFATPIVMEVVYMSKDRDHIEDMEEYYIKELDTYRNGGNNTPSGKGNHRSRNFHTKGFKFTEESRKKMSETRKRLFAEGKIKPVKMTEEHHKNLQEAKVKKLKGVMRFDKITLGAVAEIRELYNKKVPLGEDYILRENAFNEGNFFSYKQAFMAFMADKFGVSTWVIREILNGNTYKTRDELHTNSKLSYENAEWIRESYNHKTIELVFLDQKNVYKTYERAFSAKYCEAYGITHVAMYNIITRRGKYANI